MGYAHAITFPRSVCGNLRKYGKETASRQSGKEKRSKKSHRLKNIFSENYAYFPLFLTLGERKKGVVLMGD